MREEEPFCSRQFIYGCPKLPGAARLNATTSREEAGERAVRPGVIQLLLLLNSKQRDRSRESSFSRCGRSGSCCPKWRIREPGFCSPAAGWFPGLAPRPGGGGEAAAGGTTLETSTPVPPRSSVWTLGGILVPSTMDTLTFCWRKAEGETENTNNEELVRDEEVWVNLASYHSKARGHGYPSAAIWCLHFWGTPLFFFLAKAGISAPHPGVVQTRAQHCVESWPCTQQRNANHPLPGCL